MSISGKFSSLTLQSLLASSKSELLARLATFDILPLATSSTLATVQQRILKIHGVDLETPLNIAELSTGDTIRSATQQLADFQENSLQHLEEITRSANAVAAVSALVQKQKQDESEQQAAQQSCTERMNKQLSALEAQLQAIHRDTADHASNVADTPAAGCKSAITLRLTGLKEEEKEEADELLRRTAQVLDQLPNAVSPAGAIRQGAPGGNKGRAVIIHTCL